VRRQAPNSSTSTTDPFEVGSQLGRQKWLELTESISFSAWLFRAGGPRSRIGGLSSIRFALPHLGQCCICSTCQMQEFDRTCQWLTGVTSSDHRVMTDAFADMSTPTWCYHDGHFGC
jgi:hypothetical protein